jgi:CheY-like chemotaxis protein
MPRGDETILLVEDDPAVRELTYTLLRKLGYDVRRATDGEDALGMLAAEGGEDIDLVLTDVVMPRLGGEGLGAEIARIRPGLPVIYTSAYVDRGVLGRMVGERVAFLAKPYDSSQLARIVRVTLEASAQAR